MTTEKCVFEGCDRPNHAKSLCNGHYMQQHRGEELRVLQVHKFYAPPAPGRKICTACERVLDAERDFYSRATGTKHTWCKECYKSKQNARKAAKKKVSA